MSTVSLHTDDYDVNIDVVSNINIVTTRIVNNYIFSDGTDEQLDEGKSTDQIVLGGILKTEGSNTVYDKIDDINNMMEDGDTVTLAHMIDTNYNTDYKIVNFSYRQGIGENTIPIYRISLTLEKLRDE